MNYVVKRSANYQIYQIDIPGPVYQRHVIATSLKRAMDLSLTDDEQLDAGAMILVSNVTNAWIGHSPLASRSTWSLLKERCEGVVEYCREEGWERVPSKE